MVEGERFGVNEARHPAAAPSPVGSALGEGIVVDVDFDRSSFGEGSARPFGPPTSLTAEVSTRDRIRGPSRRWRGRSSVGRGPK
jgi:hypothetical protein